MIQYSDSVWYGAKSQLHNPTIPQVAVNSYLVRKSIIMSASAVSGRVWTAEEYLAAEGLHRVNIFTKPEEMVHLRTLDYSFRLGDIYQVLEKAGG